MTRPSLSVALVIILVCFGAIAPNVAADPEPARLDGSLSGNNGSTSGAFYVNSGIETSVVKWPGTWAAGSLAAGMPCSTINLSPGMETTMVIQANGNYRRCMEPAPAPAPGPEPARLTESLSGSNGTQAAAVLVKSGTQTSVVKWPATLTPDMTLSAGTRCASVDLAAGQETTNIIQVNGDYRKCIDASTPSPEPARLTEPFSGSDGMQAAALFVSNGMPTSVVRWPGTWSPNTTLKAGTPCSSVDLAVGQETIRTIQASGNYRKCL